MASKLEITKEVKIGLEPAYVLKKTREVARCFCVFASVAGCSPQVEAKTKMEGKAIALLVGLYTRNAFTKVNAFTVYKNTHQQQSNRALARFLSAVEKKLEYIPEH